MLFAVAELLVLHCLFAVFVKPRPTAVVVGLVVVLLVVVVVVVATVSI